MANIVSAAKNARKAVRRHEARVAVKSELKTLRKKTLDLAAKKAKETTPALAEATKKFDTAASNGYIHHRTASRKISRLTKQVNKLEKLEATAKTK